MGKMWITLAKRVLNKVYLPLVTVNIDSRSAARVWAVQQGLIKDTDVVCFWDPKNKGPKRQLIGDVKPIKVLKEMV